MLMDQGNQYIEYRYTTKINLYVNAIPKTVKKLARPISTNKESMVAHACHSSISRDGGWEDLISRLACA
jgi:hypothetical protein